MSTSASSTAGHATAIAAARCRFMTRLPHPPPRSPVAPRRARGRTALEVIRSGRPRLRHYETGSDGPPAFVHQQLRARAAIGRARYGDGGRRAPRVVPCRSPAFAIGGPCSRASRVCSRPRDQACVRHLPGTCCSDGEKDQPFTDVEEWLAGCSSVTTRK
jgi:hypothetical protein